jgi:hypothetical protein
MSHAGVNDFEDLESRMSKHMSSPTASIQDIGKTIDDASKQMSAQDEKIAGKIAYLMHPKIVEGNKAKYGHVFTTDTKDGVKQYSLDLGISDNNKDIVNKFATSGILNLALTKALADSPETLQQMKNIGADIREMGNSAVKFYIYNNK